MLLPTSSSSQLPPQNELAGCTCSPRSWTGAGRAYSLRTETQPRRAQRTRRRRPCWPSGRCSSSPLACTAHSSRHYTDSSPLPLPAGTGTRPAWWSPTACPPRSGWWRRQPSGCPGTTSGGTRTATGHPPTGTGTWTPLSGSGSGKAWSCSRYPPLHSPPHTPLLRPWCRTRHRSHSHPSHPSMSHIPCCSTPNTHPVTPTCCPHTEKQWRAQEAQKEKLGLHRLQSPANILPYRQYSYWGTHKPHTPQGSCIG